MHYNKLMSLVFLVPTLNEEEGISKVIDNIKMLGIKSYTILVIDGNSRDKTVEIARKKGAKVISQKSKGKGAGMHEAIATLNDEDLVIVVDGDNSYDLTKVPQMLSIINEQIMISGRRISVKGAMPLFNKAGNIVFNLLASFLYGGFIVDMLTGLRVFKVKTYRSLGLNAKNFEIETEMTLKCLKKGIKLIEIPVIYSRRTGSTKLNPIKDGARILRRILLTRFIKGF